jgi:hypothetical protein
MLIRGALTFFDINFALYMGQSKGFKRLTGFSIRF